MSRMLVSIIVLGLLMAAPCFFDSAYSQPPPYGHPWGHGAYSEIRHRIDRQQHQIDQGVASGTLTRHEQHALQKRLNHIRGEYDDLVASGRLGPREAARLNMKLDENQHLIYREKHDLQRRYY